MADQTKRRNSYGLISRLVTIGFFIGLGSWAVFNSKFKEDEAHAHVGDPSPPKVDAAGAPPEPAQDDLAVVDRPSSQSDGGNEPVSSPSFSPSEASFITAGKNQPASYLMLDKEKKNSPKKKKNNKPKSKGGAAKKEKASSALNLAIEDGGGPSATGSDLESSPPDSQSFVIKGNSQPKTPSDTAPNSAASSPNLDSGSGFSGNFKLPASNSFSSGLNQGDEVVPPTSGNGGGFSPSSLANPPGGTGRTGAADIEPGTSNFVGDKKPVQETPKSGFSLQPDSKFKSQTSAGSERPLRGSTPVADSGFALSEGDANGGASSSSAAVTPIPSPANSNGSSPFRDLGNRKLTPKPIPKSNGLAASQSKSTASNKGSSFGDIGRAKPDDVSGSPTGFKNPPQANPGSSSPSLPKSQGSFSLGGGVPKRSNPVVSNNPVVTGQGTAGVEIAESQRSPISPDLGRNPTSGVGDNQPGPATLEGIQGPAVTLQKVLPAEIQVGVEASFRLILQNVGKKPANNITVVDQIPAGTEYRNAVPSPTTRGTDGSLVWRFGELASGERKIITMNIVPKQQGSIGSVARLSVQAAATAKTICTKPELVLTHSGPQKVLKGQTARFVVSVENKGDGMAANVTIEDEVPEGFAFSRGQGERLAYEVGDLPPGKKRDVVLNLKAIEAGQYVSRVKARIGKTLAASHEQAVEITASILKMKVVGPTRRYIDREAKYQVEIQNVGTAPAENVMMVTRLPKGMKFMGANNRGQYNPREHAVYWSLLNLTPQNKGAAELRLVPVGTGQQSIQYEARSKLSTSPLASHPVIVDQLAELFFEVDDRDDPIEINGETEYRVRVVNQGSKMATEVSVSVEMPTGIQAVSGSGLTDATINGKMVQFAPIAQLDPRGEAIFKIRAKGVSDGNHLVKVMLASNERRDVVSKQESTKVYSEFR